MFSAVHLTWSFNYWSLYRLVSLIRYPMSHEPLWHWVHKWCGVVLISLISVCLPAKNPNDSTWRFVFTAVTLSNPSQHRKWTKLKCEQPSCFQALLACQGFDCRDLVFTERNYRTYNMMCGNAMTSSVVGACISGLALAFLCLDADGESLDWTMCCAAHHGS